MKILDKGFVEVYDVYGNDLTIVNSARVSFKKMKEEFDEKDEKLCNYLAEHEHTSPFRTSGIVFHVKMPIFVMRQFIRHRFGVEVNEMSGRYVEFEDCDFYVPKEFRLQSTSNKQGSDPNIPTEFTNRSEVASQQALLEEYTESCRRDFECYKRLLSFGVAKEMARIKLPLSLYTEYMVFMSLQAIGHFCRLRFDSHAQSEIREYAKAFDSNARVNFPHSYPALMKGRP